MNEFEHLLNVLYSDYEHAWPNEDDGTREHRIKTLKLIEEALKSYMQEKSYKKQIMTIKDAWKNGGGFALMEACEKLVKDGNDPIGSSFLSQIMKE